MNKTLATVLALALPATAGCGAVESPSDVTDPEEMMDTTTDDPTMPEEPTQPKPQSGTVDTTYGTNGYLVLDEVLGYPVDAALQGDKLVVCSNTTIDGKARAVVTRIGFDGAVDATFGIEDGRFMFGDNSYCGGVRVRTDDRLVVFIRIPGSLNALFRLDADAQTFDASITGSSLKAMNVTSDNHLLAAATTATGFSSRDAENPTDIATIASLTGSATRPFMIGGKHAMAGVFTSGQTGWTLVVEQTDGQLAMPSNILNVGAVATDLMHDAVQLADGSILAVGGADSDIDAMVGRLSPSAAPVAQVRDIGLTSSFRRAMVDGQDHALLFGTTTMSGASQILWQRIATSTLAVDPAYAGAGTMSLPAYHGSGDFSAVIRYNGAIYGLTSFDVETVTPGAALLKIHE